MARLALVLIILGRFNLDYFFLFFAASAWAFM